MSSSNSNWEDQLDFDDSDLPLTPALRPCKSQRLEKNQKTDHIVLADKSPVTVTHGAAGVLQVLEKPVRIIPGPAGVLQLAKIRKHSDVDLHGNDSVLSTQEYVQLVDQDVGEDTDFSSGAWIGAIEYMNAEGIQVVGCLGDVKSFIKNGKLENVVGVIKSCSPNAIGDLKVTVKDLSGTLPGSIHHKLVNDEMYAKKFTVGSVLILKNISVFSPNPSTNSLNITKKNLVKVFDKEFVPGGGEMFMNIEEIMRLVEEEEMAEAELVGCEKVIGEDEVYKMDEEALDQLWEEEAKEEREHEEWLEKMRKQEEEDEEQERQLWGYYGTI